MRDAQMRFEIPTRPLDLEHELPATEESCSPQVPTRRSGEGEARSTGLLGGSQSDDNDPAKLRERLARLQADFENARKRSLKETQDFREYAVFDTAKDLLPIIDNLERALQVQPSDSADLQTGVELTHRQLLDVLSKIGVRPIHALGERFDPKIHHAVATADTDLVEDQTIVGELQRGYMFKDRLLRPAMVTVAKKIPPEFSR